MLPNRCGIFPPLTTKALRMSSPKRESVRVLEECIELQKRKSRDYQNPNSNIVQAMHYRRGVSTIHDMISQKLLRAQSLLEAFENGDRDSPNFESLEDTYKDLINYSSFAVSYLRGKMEGQDPTRDMLNRKNPLREFVEQCKSQEDTSGGSSCGLISDNDQIEEDGFITVFPTLLGAGLDSTEMPASKIPLGESDGDTPESRIKGAYIKRVLPRGKVEVPPGEQVCSDNVAITYDREFKRPDPLSRRKKTKE